MFPIVGNSAVCNLFKITIKQTTFYRLLHKTLKRKCHLGVLFVACTGSYHFDNCRFSQWWQRCQSENVFVPVKGVDFLPVPWFPLKVAIDEVGDRKADALAEMINDGRLIKMMYWHGTQQKLDIIYHNYSDGEWHGLLWPGNATQVTIRSPKPQIREIRS